MLVTSRDCYKLFCIVALGMESFRFCALEEYVDIAINNMPEIIVTVFLNTFIYICSFSDLMP